VVPLAKLRTELRERQAGGIAANSGYVAYGLPAGHIRCFATSKARKALIKRHTCQVRWLRGAEHVSDGRAIRSDCAGTAASGKMLTTRPSDG
jgi:hypothetical protein